MIRVGLLLLVVMGCVACEQPPNARKSCCEVGLRQSEVLARIGKPSLWGELIEHHGEQRIDVFEMRSPPDHATEIVWIYGEGEILLGKEVTAIRFKGSRVVKQFTIELSGLFE